MIMSSMVMMGEREKHSASRVGVAVVAVAVAAAAIVVIVLLPKRILAFHLRSPAAFVFQRSYPTNSDTCECSQLVSSTVNLYQHSHAPRTRIGALGLELT